MIFWGKWTSSFGENLILILDHFKRDLLQLWFLPTDMISHLWRERTLNSNLCLNPKTLLRAVERAPPTAENYVFRLHLRRKAKRRSFRLLVGHICCLFCKFPISQNVRLRYGEKRSDDRKKRLSTTHTHTHTKMNPSCCILKQESWKLSGHTSHMPPSSDQRWLQLAAKKH